MTKNSCIFFFFNFYLFFLWTDSWIHAYFIITNLYISLNENIPNALWSICLFIMCRNEFDYLFWDLTFSEPILEIKGMLAIFSEKWQKRAKYLRIWVKMYKIWKYFEKGQPHACDYHTQTARICPVFLFVCLLLSWHCIFLLTIVLFWTLLTIDPKSQGCTKFTCSTAKSG